MAIEARGSPPDELRSRSEHIEHLKQTVEKLRHVIFGTKSEKIVVKPMVGFRYLGIDEHFNVIGTNPGVSATTIESSTINNNTNQTHEAKSTPTRRHNAPRRKVQFTRAIHQRRLALNHKPQCVSGLCHF